MWVNGCVVLIVVLIIMCRLADLALNRVVLVLNSSTLSRLVSSDLNWLSRLRNNLSSCSNDGGTALWSLQTILEVTWTAASGACSLREILEMNCRRRCERSLSRWTRARREFVTLPNVSVKVVRLLLLCMGSCRLRRLVCISLVA